MALTDKDKQEIAELIAESLLAAQMRPSQAADDILPLIQQPNLLVYPGPTRSRYSQVTLHDESGVARHQLRVRTSDMRTLLLNSYNAEPGATITDPKNVSPITGPREAR